MSTVTESIGSGGADMTSMTSGERVLFDSLLGTNWEIGSKIGRSWDLNNNELDLSNIQSITLEMKCMAMRSSGTTQSVELNIPGSGTVYFWDSIQVPYPGYTTYTSTVSDSRIRAGLAVLSTGSSNYVNGLIRCISYTTTDGKVHTAADPNY